MTSAEKAAFKARADVTKEHTAFISYALMLKHEVDIMSNGSKMSEEDFYCLLRSALGFEHPNMRDLRAPELPLLKPYLLEEIDAVCKKPRAVSLNGHLVISKIIPNLENNSNFENNSMNGGGKNKHARRHTRKNNKRN